MRVILFGAPGSGKGSQAKLISRDFGIPQISTGDILRQHIANQTKIGKIAEGLINDGKLVPDEIIIEIVKQRIAEDDCKNGFILDGFPRTVGQAAQLDSITKVDVVIFIDISINEVERRALTRRICPQCGKIFSIAEKYTEVCDECGSKLVQREDDKREVVRKRVDQYLAQSEPLIKFFKKRKILKTVLSKNSAEETYEEVKKILLQVRAKRK